MAKPPKIFISYAKENDITQWVEILSTQLRSDGAEAIMDQWEIVPGSDIIQYMERSISSSDFVLIICTPKYKEKAEKREGGAGYEGGIIASEQYYSNNPEKFIPLLVKGSWNEAAPVFLRDKLYLDFRKTVTLKFLNGKQCLDFQKDEFYQKLLRAIFHQYPAPPPIGKAPLFSSTNKNVKKN